MISGKEIARKYVTGDQLAVGSSLLGLSDTLMLRILNFNIREEKKRAQVIN
jgi:hypothetical protein